MRIFIDTNIWVYQLDQREPEKSRRISHWLREAASNHHIVLSTQVLIELRSVLTRKLKPAMSHEHTRQALNALSAFDVLATDTAMVLDAHELAEKEQLSWFDALIVEAAIRSGCDQLVSEDLSDGRWFGKLKVSNPFLAELH
jgi:predicted nucleic acid-binding protein